MFGDRAAAGRMLAKHLAAYARRTGVVVLALPTGGVPVAREIADALGAELDLIFVRKLALPAAPDQALGAVAPGGVVHWHAPAVTASGLTEAERDLLASHEQVELLRREAAYADSRRPVSLDGKTVIVVDDGVVTGASLQAALMALRGGKPAWVVVAVPVAPMDAHQRIGTAADEFVCLHTPWQFHSLSEWYGDFNLVSDAEARRLLDRSPPG